MPLEIDDDLVQCRGWAEGGVDATSGPPVEELLLAFAARYGRPVPSRRGGDVFEYLRPVNKASVRLPSLSRSYSTGEFPLHSDTAHWVTPCRYVLLACLSPGEGARCTYLLDARNLPFEARELQFLERELFLVRNGQLSFYSSVMERRRSFIRFDPGCMTPVTADGQNVLDLLSRRKWMERTAEVQWFPGKVILFDNWRFLHGRSGAMQADGDRILARILIQ